MQLFYFIDFLFPKSFNTVGKYNATSKARNDVEIIVKEYNPVYIPIYRYHPSKIMGVLEVLLKFLWQLIRLPKKSKIFIQYPMINLKPFKLLCPLLKKHEIIAIVHDLQSYRYPLKNKVQDEVKVLNSFSKIIVHTEAMKEELKSVGVIKTMYILGCFDYLLDNNQSCQRINNTIVYAGSLGKSMFLKELHKINTDIKYNLYGKPKPEIVYTDNMIYKGAFSPNDISMIEGEWGLLWDGDSIETCQGNFGEYLQLIAPHKFSLYLACGLKIICWKKSAVAELVEKYNLGITVESLFEINNKICTLSQERLQMIEKEVNRFSKMVQQGMMLKGIMENILGNRS